MPTGSAAASFTRQTFLASKPGTKENIGNVATFPAIHIATNPWGLAASRWLSTGTKPSR